MIVKWIFKSNVRVMAIAALAVQIPTIARAETVPVISYHDFDCAGWIAYHSGTNNEYAAYQEAWATGYLSAVAVDTGSHFLNGVSHASVVDWISKYCFGRREQDLSTVLQAYYHTHS